MVFTRRAGTGETGEEEPSRADPRGGRRGAVAPSRDDPVVAAASEVVGGPAGRRVRPRSGWWTPVRVMIAMVIAVYALGLAQKDFCHDRAWAVEPERVYAHLCYTDMAPLYGARGFADGNLPYIDTGDYRPLEYPVLTGAFMTVAGFAARTADDADDEVVRFFDANALLLLFCAILAVVATVRLAGRRPWDAALVALAPALPLAATINWDLFAIALTALGMLAWARRRPVLAGLLLGLGVAAKLYPLLLLGPLFLLCLRAGRLGAFMKTLLGAAAAWAAVNLPVMAVAFDGWKVFYEFNEERPGDLGSIWLVLARNGNPVEDLNTVWVGLFALMCAGIGALCLAAPRRPRFAQVAFLVVVAFLLVNKVYSPQYVLWLIPLAALARPRWRDFLIWQACELVYFFAVWYYLISGVDPNHGLPQEAYWVAIIVRMLGQLYLSGVVVRDILRPEQDPVRADGTDDPTGGVLDGAPDRLVIGRTSRGEPLVAPQAAGGRPVGA